MSETQQKEVTQKPGYDDSESILGLNYSGLSVIIPHGKTLTIKGTRSCPKDKNNGSVFLKGRTVTLNPYAIGTYPVTQELFEKVMEINPSDNIKEPSIFGNINGTKWFPVECINRFSAMAFCNKLSLLCGLEPCYSVECVSDWANLEYGKIPEYYDHEDFEEWNKIQCNFNANGYRLPTECEWECAARGGDPEDDIWKEDDVGFVWYKENSFGRTKEVGESYSLNLDLCDICGNVWEMCWDFDYSPKDLLKFDDKGNLENTGVRATRGGSYMDPKKYCKIISIIFQEEQTYGPEQGFRIARSL